MENLKTLAEIVEKVNLKTSDFVLTDRNKKLNTDVFYEKILSDEFNSDTDASQFFFSNSSLHSNYKNLKYSLKEKLINTIFFLAPDKYQNDHEKAYLFCCKYLAIARILVSLRARSISTEIYHKVLKKAQAFELTEFIVPSSRMLRIYYGSIVMSKEKFHYYNDIYKKQKLILEAESLAEEYFNLLVLPYGNGKAKQEEVPKIANEFYQKLACFLKTYKSPYLHFIGNLIRIKGLLSNNDYTKTIKVCEEAILFFKEKPYIYRTPIRAFLHDQLVCYIQLKDYQRGKLVAEEAIASIKRGSHSWFINKELCLMLALHSKEYEKAYDILTSTVSYYKFDSMKTTLKERWLIHKAYINFLVYINKINTNASDATIKKFRLGKFLNSVPNYSKDKRGLNIPILIIQILFMIVKKDYDQSIDRFEAIKKYCSRYLCQNENLRSNCFINMLLQIPISNFHKAGVERRAKKYYDKLLATPLDVANQAHEIEIIPYEDLWNFVMDLLDVKTSKI